jgi:hypothetical protein
MIFYKILNEKNHNDINIHKLLKIYNIILIGKQASNPTVITQTSNEFDEFSKTFNNGLYVFKEYISDELIEDIYFFHENYTELSSIVITT